MRASHLAAIIGIPVLALFGLIVSLASTYQVDETQYALQLRFGEVHAVRTQPGLYLKAPFLDAVQRIDRRTLRADIPPREVPDRDKERLIIDTVVRYRITDPLAFRKTLRRESTARNRLEQIMYSAIRDTIAQRDRTEVIGARPRRDTEGKIINNDAGLPVYESLLDTRDQIGQDIQNRVATAVAEQGYGIDIISADIKRADFPQQVEAAIIHRLQAERHRVAARWRADGEEEYRKRTAEVQAQADIIIAEANRDARRIRGQGDAEAIRIVQEALLRDPDFYAYLRTLESYEKAIQDGALLVITDGPDSYLNRLTKPPGTEP